MYVFDSLKRKESDLSVIGLGYVGLPLAVAFSNHFNVNGFDINSERIALYKSGKDITSEVGDDCINNTSVRFTDLISDLENTSFFIVTVPTPVNEDKTPNLEPIKMASSLVGSVIKKGAVVVFESTVYPGATEEVCVPIIEKESGFICGRDFFVGYSPERINPSDKIHRLENITKIVSGIDDDTLDEIAKVYETVVEAGVYKAINIKTAEAAKVIENCQRDINIAFMNELSIIFHKIGIDTKDVLEAAGTKWNFLNFYPGLVGGHCIGVDPYYLTHKADEVGYHSQVILSGRRINDEMGAYIAENIIKALSKTNRILSEAKVVILGFTFKENCQDTRNTKVIDIIRELREYGISPIVADPIADNNEAKKLYDIDIVGMDQIEKSDAIVVCVSHEEFKSLDDRWFDEHLKDDKKILFDIKGIYDKLKFEKNGYLYWRL